MTEPRTAPKSLSSMSARARAAVTVFGLGHMRPFPGTWGSLPPVGLGIAMILVGLGPAETPWLFKGVMLAVAVVFSLACVVLGEQSEARYHGKDPSQVVADETAGQALALALLPASAAATPLMGVFTMILAFFAFRLFDITKPPPASQLQRVPGGWGILLDDLFAGVYAAGLVALMLLISV